MLSEALRGKETPYKALQGSGMFFKGFKIRMGTTAVYVEVNLWQDKFHRSQSRAWYKGCGKFEEKGGVPVKHL